MESRKKQRCMLGAEQQTRRLQKQRLSTHGEVQKLSPVWNSSHSVRVEQEQIQKRTFTNWVNAQLSKRSPPVTVLDLFNDFRDGARLLDLLEVMCGQRMSREKGKGMFQHRAHIEKGLAFLRKKSIKLVNINVSDIMDGKPSIILGLIWTIIMHFHIEELASTLSFSSRQSSLESLASLDTYSNSSSARSSPVPPRGEALHTRFRISAKKALLLWVREQCHKAGCTLNVKDFKASWRSGVVFLAILTALRPDLVDLSKARSRTNRQNLEEAFRIAERELRVPRLLDPADVDVRDPDEKSIMTYVAQFLQYSKDTPVDEEMQGQYIPPAECLSPVNLPSNFTPAIATSPLRQTSSHQKAKEVTCWLEQAYQELLEGWDSTEGESYAERYHVFQTFVVSFNEQRRPVMPFLTAMKRTPRLSEEQRELRHAWDSLAEKLREYKAELDLSLPAPLDSVGLWLRRVEEALADGEDDTQDHGRAAQDARDKQELLKVCVGEMPHHMKTFQVFQNMDEYGEMLVPTDKLEEMKRRFTSVRVSAKYHGIKLEYQEHRHTVLDLLSQLKIKLRAWKRAYISQEAVRFLIHDWNETVHKQELPSLLEGALYKLKHSASKYTSKSALAGDSSNVNRQVKDLEAETARILQDMKMVKGTMGRVLAAWDSYSDTYSSLHAWLEQGTQTSRHRHRTEVTTGMMSEWSSRQAHLNEVGNYLTEITDTQTSRSLSDDLCRINLMWADFARRMQFDLVEESSLAPAVPQTLQCLVRESNQLLKEPVEVLSGSLRTYRKRLQFMMNKIKDVDLDSISPSHECSAETLNKLKQAIPEVLQTLCEAMQVCEELQQSVSGLDGRLAELLHWEAEAREFYQLLKERAHKHQRGQDARTRFLISRGLQLEGQVVMEEQDLQVMVMSGQKSSPLQYLIASTMQDRVRAAVVQSQEAVGMLSSLGARRERSPTGRQPPQKIFVQEKETENQQPQTSSTTQPMSTCESADQADSQPSVKPKSLQPSQQSDQVAVPKTQPQAQPVPMIVVQEYQEEKMSSSPQAYTQTLSQVLSQETMKEPQHQGVSKGHGQSQPLAKDQATASQPQQQNKAQSAQQDIQQQTQQGQQGQQQHMQVQQQGATQQQPPSQQPVKLRKSQARSENRPWLQKKVQAEVLPSAHPGTEPKDKSTVVSEAQSQSTVSSTVVTPDSSQAQAKMACQTQAKLSEVQHQQAITKPRAGQIEQQQPVSQPKVVSQVQHQQLVKQNELVQVQQQQSVMQPKVSQVQQHQRSTQMPPKAHPQAMTSAKPHKQPQPMMASPVQVVTQQHPLPQAFTATQPPTVSQKKPEPQTAQQAQPPTMSPVHPQVMTQRQPQPMVQDQLPVTSKTQQQRMEMGEAQQTMTHIERHPSVPMQPPIMAQGQPRHPVPQDQPRRTAPIQPRIITMPQGPPQAQIMGIGQPQANFQPHLHSIARPQLQPKVQHPQWRPVAPEVVAQSSYHEVQAQGLMQAQMYPQSHPQSQGVPQMQAPPQQWCSSVGGPSATQTYSNVQSSSQVQVQSQMYQSVQMQTPQWGPQRPEPLAPPYVQMRPQIPVQPIAPSQHWRPIRPEVISHSYQRVPTPDQGPVSQYSPAQHQAHPRPQSPPQNWGPIHPEPKSQVRSQKTVPKISQQQVTHQPLAPPPPPSQPPVRSQGPGPQQSQGPAPQQPQGPAPQQPQGPAPQQPQGPAPQQPQGPAPQQPQGPAPQQPQGPAPQQPQGPAPQQPQARQQQLAQNKAEAPPQVQIQVQSQTPQTQPQVQASPKPQSSPPEQTPQSAPWVKAPALAQAPPQAYTEAYAKAQALARNRFEEAKHCLQEHILEAINVFKDKKITDEQALVKEETLKGLDAELLDQFLRAAEGMEAFCTPSQLRDMEFFAQSVRTQWEAIQIEMSAFVGQLRFQIKLLHFNSIARQCEIHFNNKKPNSRSDSRSVQAGEACFSADGSLVVAGHKLEALKDLCDTLSPEDAHRLAQAQLRECEKRLAAIQRQFSGDQDTPMPGAGSVLVEQMKESSPQKISTASVEKASETTSPEASPVSTQRPKPTDKKEIIKQTSTEEDRYRSSRFALQAQLNRNEQSMLGDRPSESATDLRKQLRELKALRDETESLWSEYEVQCSQCVQFNERGVEQDRAELTVKCREQRAQLQSRVDSLGSALDLMDSIEHHIAEISEHLDKFIKEPKDVKGYTLINTNLLKDVKDLDESIQAQMDRLARFDSEPSNLDLRDRSSLTQVVLSHRSSLDRLRQQVRKSDAAARALERFLMSLRTVDQDIAFVQGAPCSDVAVLQDSRAKLALIRKGVGSLKDKAPQLDMLLGGARMEVTREGHAVSCLDMVGALVQRAEDADDRLMIRQEELRKEQQSQGLRVRRKNLQAELRKVLGAAEKQGLKEPTMPAVQQRIRALSDLETQLNALRPEYQSIKGSVSKVSPDTEQTTREADELDSLWEETERAVTDRQEQCRRLLELLKKFQSCRSYLGGTLQKAEQTVSEQASYMSKDSLQRLVTKVCGIKDDLSGLGPRMEDFRNICRQLQSQLKKIPDCSETPFETEADALVDSWLDISEKTDGCMDNLRVGLEVWEKQLMLGGEVEAWATAKLNLFAQSHTFTTETEVLQMKEEIQTQEENIERFHRKSLEIQNLLQSKESPLELQVMETGLRKKMDEVKEVFAGCTEVFQELLTVRAHLIQRIDECRSAIHRIQASVSAVTADNTDHLHQQLQDLSDELLDQDDQADSLMKEITLMSSVTGPQAIEELTNDCKRVKDSITTTHELIGQKKEQEEKNILVQSIKNECQLFEDWLQDVQLSVNECFENPERRQDVEASMQRLQGFLASKEGEQRLLQVKESVERKGRIPADDQAQLSVWQQEQEGEMATLRAHCQGRHKQLHDIVLKLDSLQEEHDHLQGWLEQKEQIPEQREKLRQVHEDFLKESGRVEAFSDLLTSVRLRGLRGDPLLKNSEALIDRYHSLGIRLENQAQVHKALEKEVEDFYAQEEGIRAWIRDLKQGLDSVHKDASVEEKLCQAQAVLRLSADGNSRLASLSEVRESLCACEELEEQQLQELTLNRRNVEDEWRRLLDSAQQLKNQAELQGSLLKNLEDLQEQERRVRSWVQQQKQSLACLDRDTPNQEIHSSVQAVLNLQHEGNSKLAALRKSGESIIAHKELGSEKRLEIEESQRDLEQEWEKVLQAAQELKIQSEQKDSLLKELQHFQNQGEDAQVWIRDLKKSLESLGSACPFEEQLHQAQAVLNHGAEGDSKLSALRESGESVCALEGLEEDIGLSVRQTLMDVQQEWAGVLGLAEKLRSRAKLQDNIAKELQDFFSQGENVQTWVKKQQQRFDSLDKDTPVQERLNISQAILDLQLEGDSMLAALRMRGESVCVHSSLDESQKHSIHQTVGGVQEKWRMVLEIAEELQKQAELQDSLAKELQAYQSQEEDTQSWVEEKKQELGSLGKSTHGTQDQIKERLNKAQAVLSLRSEGNGKIASLKRGAESLCARKDLDEEVRLTVLRNLKCLEENWKGVLQHSQELHSLLRSVVERLVSCQCQREQTQSRLEQLRKQTEALPRCFPWPGLGERRHAVEQARTLVEKARSLTPTLSALRALGREMSQLTRDPSWSDPTWAAMEESIPGLIKELLELSESLEEGIHTERVCVQLVEQHSAAQDWLREQVKGFGPLPTDRQGLQGSINTLKALLQTVKREECELKELDVVKDSLSSLCTPGGCDALTLEVSQLHDLCASSENEITERLAACQARLADIDLKLEGRTQGLRAQAEGLQNELRAQDHCLEFGEGHRTISQLQESWHNFKNCEKELEALEGKVRDLGQELRMVPSDEDLPSDVISLIDAVTLQYCSLRSKLLERQNDCADSVVHCVREALHALNAWNQSEQPSSDSASALQAMIEEGARLHKSLQVAVSHKQLLRDCLGPELAGKLERDSATALKDADSLITELKQRMKDLEEKIQFEALRLSMETRNQLDSQVSSESHTTTDPTSKTEIFQTKQTFTTIIVTQDSKKTDETSVVQAFEPLQKEDASMVEKTLEKTDLPHQVSTPGVSETSLPVSVSETSEEEDEWVIVEPEKHQDVVDKIQVDLSERPEELHGFEILADELHKQFAGSENPEADTIEESKVCDDSLGLAEHQSEELVESISASMDVPQQPPLESDETAMLQPVKTLHKEISMSFTEEIVTEHPPKTEMEAYQGEPKTAGLPKSTTFSSATSKLLETEVNESALPPQSPTEDDFGKTHENLEASLESVGPKPEMVEYGSHTETVILVSSQEKIDSDLIEVGKSSKALQTETPIGLANKTSEEIDASVAKQPLVPSETDAHLSKSETESCLPSTVLTVSSEVLTEISKSTLHHVRDSPTCEEEINTSKFLKSKGQADSRDSQLVLKSDTEIKISDGTYPYIPDATEHMDGDNKVPRKKVASLVLDTDSVHIHTTEVMASTDPNTLRIVSGAATGFDITLSEPVVSCNTGGSKETEEPQVAEEDAAKERDICLGKPGQENVAQIVAASTESVSQLQAVDPADEVAYEPSVFVTNKTQEIQETTAPTVVGTLSRTNGPNARRQDREETGRWTTDNGPHEAHRVIEPLGLTDWTNNGPREIQQRYIILDQREAVQIDGEPAAEAEILTLGAREPEGGEEVEVSEPAVSGKESGEEFVETEVKECQESRKEQAETIKAILAPPVRRKRDSVPSEKLFASTSVAIDDKTKRTVDLGDELPRVSESEQRPSQPQTSHQEEDDRFAVSLENQPEVVGVPSVPSIQVSSLEVLPTPPSRRRKDKLGGERMSLDLDSQPTPPARRRKEKGDDRRYSLDLEASPKPPSRRQKDLTSLELEKSMEKASFEDLVVKPTPPVRRKASRVEIDTISLTSETEDLEYLVKPTPPVRRRNSRVMSDQEKGMSLIKPTPPVRRKISRAGSEISLASRHEMEEEALVRPTPPVRRRNSRIEIDTSIPMFQLQESLIKPTPPLRRKEQRTESEKVLTVEIPKPEQAPPKREGMDITDVDMAPKLEESSIKPSPPNRRKKDTTNIEESAMLKEPSSKPSPPNRQKKEKTDVEVSSVLEEPSTKPSPPIKPSEYKTDVEISPMLEEPLVKPSPPSRQKRDSTNLELAAILEEPLVKTSQPIRQSKDEGDLTAATMLEEPSIIPSLPNRRKKITADVEVSTMLEEPSIKPSVPSSQKNDQTDVKGASMFEDPLVEPSQPNRQSQDKTDGEVVPMLEEPSVKPSPPSRRKKDITDIEVSLQLEEQLVEPGQPIRHSEDYSDVEASSMLQEPSIIPSPPNRRKKVTTDPEMASVLEEPSIKPSPPIRQSEDETGGVVAPKREKPLVEPDQSSRQSEDKADVEASPILEEPLTKPSPSFRPSEYKTDVVVSPVQEEPLIEPSRQNRRTEKTETFEVQTISKQEDEEKIEHVEECYISQEQPEKGLVSADVESTGILMRTEDSSLVQELVQNIDQSETPAQESSISRTESQAPVPKEEEEEEEPLGPTMKEIFTEIKKMSKTGPNSLLIETRPYEHALDILDTSLVDLEGQLNRLVIRILSCRNLPAVLNPTDMAKQVEEAEHCRQSAQKQISSISKQDQANGDVGIIANGSAYDPESMQRLSCQWTAALWDAVGTVHSKEAQLQLVIDYDRQTQKAQITFEKLSAELVALRICPVESSFVEEQRLRSFLRTMEQERTVLGELIQTHSQLSPYLSSPEKASAQAQVNRTQRDWRELERSVEKTLHNVSAYTKESFGLLDEINTLKDHLENLRKILGPFQKSSVNWDRNRAEDLIELSADFTAAQQSYFHLKQRSDALSQGLTFKTEMCRLEQNLQSVKDKLDLIGEQLASSSSSVLKSSNPTMGKIVKVITDALAWAKQTERDIEGRKRKVSLFPEEVHRQIKDLKKLQSEMNLKRSQLQALTEEVAELIPELDQDDVPMITTFLEELNGLSKSTAKKLDSSLDEIESSLQTREKISENIADVASWILGHLQNEALRREDYQSFSAADLDRRLRQSQETLVEAEKQSAVAEALLMKSKDIASELSISENAWLSKALTKLQEDIKEAISYEKYCSQEITDLLQNQDSSQKKVTSIENNLRQITVEIKDHRFPITKNSLSSLEPFKHTIIEHKCQMEQVNPCPEDKRRELLGVISELHHKMKALDTKAQSHERFLSLRQRVEDLRENIEVQVPKTKDESIDKEERYKTCQALLTQLLFIKPLCKETSDELENISPDLYPSQLFAEQKRLKQNLDSLNTWEMTIQNNLQIVEWEILKGVHYPSEQRAVRDFLEETNLVLEKPCWVEPKQEDIDRELRKCLNIRKNVEARMRVLEVLEKKKGIGHIQSQKSKNLAELANNVLDNCDQRMNNLSKAMKLLKNYSTVVTSTIRFLQEAESVILPSLCSARSCSERLKDIQQALSALDTEFQSHVAKLQDLAPFSSIFPKEKSELLHIEILSHLLVRESTVKAQAQLRLEALERCVNCQRSVRACYEELCQRVRDSETSLAECASKKIASQKDCAEQQEILRTLVEEVDTLPGRLDELKEWCPVQGCSTNREDAVSALWGQVAKLQRCARSLGAHSEQRGEEWKGITKNMEQASLVLEQMEAELPELNRGKATGEELQELLQFWSQCHDSLDCQHRALSALELRVARLLGVPSHLEQAPPIPLCQQLQNMQERYRSLKERSSRGRKAVQAEMEEREKVREELQGVRDWLVAAVTLLSAMEHAPSTKQLQEVHSELCTQKAVLQRIMEGLRMKYSDMYMLVPVEIEGPLQEVSVSLQQVEEQVEEAVEKSGPLHRLDARLSEIRAGLESVQIRLEQKSPSIPEAEITQKRVWDELDGLHSRLAGVEVELQDVGEEKLQEAQVLTERLAQTQQLHTHLTKQAEDRTTFLNKMQGWLKEHEEMVKGSKIWITEAQSWLTAPCTYTTAKCLDGHVNALQMVLDDSEQIRQTLQGFESVLKEMQGVCDVSALQQELSEADQRVAHMQQNLVEPVSQLEHAAAEVDAMESELKIMEKDVADLRSALTSKEGISQDKLKAAEGRIELMKRTVAELQSCKAGLCLPEGAENTLTVFKSADLLLNQLLELEQLVLEHTVVMVVDPPAAVCEKPALSVPPTIAEEEAQESVQEQGQIEIVRMKEDVLSVSGAVLMTVEETSPEQRLGWVPENSSQSPAQTQLPLHEEEEELEEEEEDIFLDVSEEEEYSDYWEDDEEEEYVDAKEEDGPSSSALGSKTVGNCTMEDVNSGEAGESVEQGETVTDPEAVEPAAGASDEEAGPRPAATARTQSPSKELVTKTPFVRELSKSPSRGQQKCVVS